MDKLSETNRIRAFRGLPPLTAGMSKEELRKQLLADQMMGRTRAAVAYVDTARTEEVRRRLALSAFMAIFHPEYPSEKVREMVNDR